MGEEGVLGVLLSDGGTALNTCGVAENVVARSAGNAHHVEAGVLVEGAVLRGQHSVLGVFGDLLGVHAGSVRLTRATQNGGAIVPIEGRGLGQRDFVGLGHGGERHGRSQRQEGGNTGGCPACQDQPPRGHPAPPVLVLGAGIVDETPSTGRIVGVVCRVRRSIRAGIGFGRGRFGHGRVSRVGIDGVVILELGSAGGLGRLLVSERCAAVVGRRSGVIRHGYACNLWSWIRSGEDEERGETTFLPFWE